MLKRSSTGEQRAGRTSRFLSGIYRSGLLFILSNLFISSVAIAYSQDKITVDLKDENISKVFEIIQRDTDYEFLYQDEELLETPLITLSIRNAGIPDVLDLCFRDTHLSYRITGKTIVVFTREMPQEITVRGRVTDETGEPLPGVGISVKETSRGTVTGEEGNYELEDVSRDAVLVFQFLGYQTREIALSGQEKLDVSLREDIAGLDEVLVVGYGAVRKSDLTGSVSQLKAREINAFPQTNMMQALSGRVAGVQVLQSSGAPGAGINVRIRGTNSIQGGNEPLYVVDGFPYSGNPTNLNNADIESIEILKDASATAIYGSRGANGVVIITTKQGQAGGTRVDFEASYSVQNLRKKLDLMNAEEYAILHNIQARNDGLDPYFTQDEIDGFGEGFDWQDFIFQEAPMQSYSLNVSSGNANTRFSIGGSIFSQGGIIPQSDYNRYSLRTNIDHDISEKLRISLSSTLSNLTTETKQTGGGQRGNSLISAAISASPLSNPYNDDGTYTVLAEEFPFVAVDLRNPLNQIYEDFNETKANRLLANAAIIYKPVPALEIKLSGGIENNDDRTDSHRTRNYINSNGSASVGTRQFRSLLSENTITYNKTIQERHQISAVAGFTYQDFVATNLSGSGTNFLSDVYESYNLGAAENPGIPGSSYTKSVLLSSLARINYSFDDKYLVTASIRADGSSKYSHGNKWGYFPSGAIAWKISEEDFMQEVGAFSDLKLRASWGLTGSQAIREYATLNMLFSGYTIFNDRLFNRVAPGTQLPGALRWETTEQIDFGLDFGLLDNRILITADYYIKNTRDLLNTVQLPTSMGFTSTIQNVGKVRNRGFELAVDAQVSTGEFSWDITSNLSINRNKVVNLHEGEDILGGSVSVLVMQDNVNILREGRPIGQFWGYRVDGYNEQGHFKYQDIDGDGTVTEHDKAYIGDPNPNFIAGFTSTMFYKNFELSVFFQGSYGNDIFNVSSVVNTLDYGQGLNMPREVFLDHWTPENPDAKYPVISRSTSTNVSDFWVEDGSYLRLKNISLGYHFSVERLGVNNAQVYLSGQNLLTLTKYSWWDPEVNPGTNGIDHFSYPSSRIITAGVRVHF